MRKTIVSISIITLALIVIGVALYFRAEATCAPIIAERIARGYDNAPTLCAGEFFAYLPIAGLVWIISILYFVFKTPAKRKISK